MNSSTKPLTAVIEQHSSFVVGADESRESVSIPEEFHDDSDFLDDEAITAGVAPSPAEIEQTMQTQQATPEMMQMFLAALQQMSANNRETTLAAIQELKKLSPEDQEKADREKKQLMEQTLRRVDAAKAQEAEIAERQESCGHVMPNGQTNFRGQVLSNGWAHVFCSHCHKAYDFQATDVEANKSGLNVDKWGPNAHTLIKNRAVASQQLVPPPVPRVPAGATIIFG